MPQGSFWVTPRLLLALALALIILFVAFGYFLVSQPVTTIILVRHAEKNIEANTSNPDLSTLGHERAEELVHVLSNAGIRAIYASQYLRTQQTVDPIAARLGLRINEVDANNTPELVRRIKVAHKGEVVLISGHSNTVPEIMTAIGVAQAPEIPDSEYDNLFVVTVSALSGAKMLRLKYGHNVISKPLD